MVQNEVPLMSPESTSVSGQAYSPVVSDENPLLDLSQDFSQDSDSVLDGDHGDDWRETITTPPERWPWLTYLSPSQYAPLPLVYRNVLKCAIAYFIASLFTFSPYLSAFISDLASYDPGGQHKPVPSGHTIATIAVYFNPAKTVGGMLEADMYCFCGLLFSTFMCLSGAAMFWWLYEAGMELAANGIVILWIGISMSIIAFMKVWMASPQFNTACSMMVIIIFVVLIKEGGPETLTKVTLIVICGSATSNLVCYLIWPSSATGNLRVNMAKTLDSFSTVLTMLTDAFLLDDSTRSLSKESQERLQRAVEDNQGSFTSLKKDLGEAWTEYFWYVPADKLAPGENCHERGRKATNIGRKSFDDAVNSMNRLAQHLNGLRSGTRLQYELTKLGVTDGPLRRSHNVVSEADDEDEETLLLRAAGEMFGDLVDELGSPLKALSKSCTNCLKRLRESFLSSHSRPDKDWKGMQSHEFHELVDSIDRALVRFERTSNHAIMRLYKKSNVSAGRPESINVSVSDPLSSHSSTSNAEGTQLLSTGDNEHVFLVYFFIFTLQEFAVELTSLVDAMSRIYCIEQEWVHRPWWWVRIGGGLMSRAKRFWMFHKQSVSRPASITNFLLHKSNHRRPPFFPKIKPHAPNTILTPSQSKLTFIGRVKQRLWKFGERLHQRHTKYAIKVGMATALLSSPAFFETSRPIFLAYWGDWALISFFVVIAPTIGTTNRLSLHRVAATIFGASVATGIYMLFWDNPVVLSIFGFFFSLPCFYFIVAKPAYVSAGRFTLLTYNLTCLYCYNLREKGISPVFIGFRRATAVIAGVVAAAAVSRFWWPSEARKELSEGLGELCVNIGWLYTRLVASNSYSPEVDHQEEDSESLCDESSSLLPANTLNTSIREFMAMELHLQIKLIELQGLLAQTPHEPRLKGPFPVQMYRTILISLQTILDRLHSMRCVTTREEWYTSVRKDFIIPVNKERHDMVGNIILSFSIFGSAFRLKAPLPPYLPPVEQSRRRLVEAIRKLDVVKNRDVKGSRQLLFFAYALTMKGVTQELEHLGRTLQTAFGVIGQTAEEFEALFVDSHVA